MEPESVPESTMQTTISSVRSKLDTLELIDNYGICVLENQGSEKEPNHISIEEKYEYKDKNAIMKSIYDEIMALLDGSNYDFETAAKKIKAEYFYLKGKTMDFIPEHQKEAEETL